MINDKRPWLILTLVVSLLYGLLGLQEAFQGDWIVQDDARQHIFWMARYLDPELFPDDLIADYFESVAPFGYSFLYSFAAKLGIDPFIFNKLIPIVLRLITTYYFFLFCWEIFPLPLGCTITTLLLNHNLWLKDDIISATPRAFLYPFLIAFLYYFIKRSLFFCLVIIVLLGLFYPQTVFIIAIILILNLIKWQKFRPHLTSNKTEQYFCLISLAVAFLVLLPYAISTSIYEPIITRSQAIMMPEFHNGGRSNFFKDNFFDYFLGKGNGVMISTSLFNPIILLSSLFFPVIVQRRNTFSLVGKITPHLASVINLAIASLIMFFFAHLFLFKLHLPSRYTAHSLKFVVVIFAGITITVTLKYYLEQINKKFPLKRRKIVVALIILLLTLLTYNSFLDSVSPNGYKIGSYPELYKFFQQQPKDIVIASLTKEADNLPTFTKRSILVSREYAIPYHLGYYQPFSAKAKALIKAQYSNNLAEVKQFIEQYKVTFWLIEEDSFSLEYFSKNRWLRQYKPEQQNAIANLEQNIKPIVAASQDTCQVFATANFKVIETQCLVNFVSD